jgi:hypothetical protein
LRESEWGEREKPRRKKAPLFEKENDDLYWDNADDNFDADSTDDSDKNKDWTKYN